jgi:type II secretory pathway pseudopilin PulG
MRIIACLAALIGFAGCESAQDARIGRAAEGVVAIAAAVERHRAETGENPETLDELARPRAGGRPALLKPEQLTDPWGNPYRYDPSGQKNNGKRPDVWTMSVPAKPGEITTEINCINYMK